MFRYYLLLALRMLKKQKVYTFINVLGLSIGVCACVVIYLVVSHEFSYDRFHPDKERIFRITGEVQRVNGDKEFVNSVVPDVAGIEHAIPGFEAKTGIWHYDARIQVPKGNNEHLEFAGEQVVVTSPDYFRIFRYRWLAGDEATALQEPNSVVITQERADIYFGKMPPQTIIGRVVVYNDSLVVKITGVIKEWEENTDLPYSDFISLSTANAPFLKKDIPSTNWSSLRPHGTMAFVKLHRNTSAEQVNLLLKEYLIKNAKAAFYGKLVKLELQSIVDLHFTDAFNRGDDGDGFRKANRSTMYMLIGIALFILILAIVNFVNLSTAISMQRSREIGVRKVLGVRRSSLMLQLLTETLLLSLLAVIVACVFVNPAIRFFGNYLPPDLHFNILDFRLLVFLLLLTTITTFLAGAYPSKVLASLAPVLSLKGLGSNTSPANVTLRRGLIVFQFVISLIFIIGTLVINYQLQYMRTKDKGFDTDAIITVNNWGAESAKMQTLAQEVRGVAGVNDVILQGDPPMGLAETSALLSYRGDHVLEFEVIMKSADENFIPFYKIKLLAGSNLADADSSRAILINETCAKAVGFSNVNEAVGKVLHSGNGTALPIVGVVSDFHMGSFRSPIRPMIIQHNPERETSMAISIASTDKSISDTREIIAGIEQRWKKIYPQQQFNFIFLEDYIGWLFEKEEQTASLISAAMIVTIFISCMGLFGLAMYTAERRTREIGIRKILGASVFGITAMLSRDFIKLVIIAALIASPFAWFVMNQWLQDFVYRVDVSWWIFIVAVGIALVIAIITIGFQSIRAALANPVKSLRTE